MKTPDIHPILPAENQPSSQKRAASGAVSTDSDRQTDRVDLSGEKSLPEATAELYTRSSATGTADSRSANLQNAADGPSFEPKHQERLDQIKARIAAGVYDQEFILNCVAKLIISEDQ